MSADHFSKYSMLLVQKLARSHSEEELRSVGPRSGVRHGKDSNFIVEKFFVEFVIEWTSEDRFSACSCACWITSLELRAQGKKFFLPQNFWQDDGTWCCCSISSRRVRWSSLRLMEWSHSGSWGPLLRSWWSFWQNLWFVCSLRYHDTSSWSKSLTITFFYYFMGCLESRGIVCWNVNSSTCHRRSDFSRGESLVDVLLAFELFSNEFLENKYKQQIITAGVMTSDSTFFSLSVFIFFEVSGSLISS